MAPRERIPDWNDDNPKVVSPRNLALPLWVVIPMMCAFGTATIWFINTLNRFDNRFNSIDEKLNLAAGDRWRLSYQRQWKYDAERMNANLKLPDPDEIVKRYNP